MQSKPKAFPMSNRKANKGRNTPIEENDTDDVSLAFNFDGGGHSDIMKSEEQLYNLSLNPINIDIEDDFYDSTSVHFILDEDIDTLTRRRATLMLKPKNVNIQLVDYNDIVEIYKCPLIELKSFYDKHDAGEEIDEISHTRMQIAVLAFRYQDGLDNDDAIGRYLAINHNLEKLEHDMTKKTTAKKEAAMTNEEQLMKLMEEHGISEADLSIVMMGVTYEMSKLGLSPTDNKNGNKLKELLIEKFEDLKMSREESNKPKKTSKKVTKTAEVAAAVNEDVETELKDKKKKKEKKEDEKKGKKMTKREKALAEVAEASKIDDDLGWWGAIASVATHTAITVTHAVTDEDSTLFGTIAKLGLGGAVTATAGYLYGDKIAESKESAALGGAAIGTMGGIATIKIADAIFGNSNDNVNNSLPPATPENDHQREAERAGLPLDVYMMLYVNN